MAKVLDILSEEPVTAHFISKSLAMRFVSDKPPAELVDHLAKTFLSTDGDLRETMRTMFTSPEFWAPENIHAKVKTPLEMMASALRATERGCRLLDVDRATAERDGPASLSQG